MMPNLVAAWIGILLGCVAGAVQGLFFHREDWLGGYGSWPRRMIRLGHISFFGIAFINLAFGLTRAAAEWPSRLLIAGAIGMPVICYLSAVNRRFRHLFAAPVLSVTAAASLSIWRLLQ